MSFLSSYFEPIKNALIMFPLIALLITVPYFIVQYRRRGAVLIRRVIIVYSFVLYLMCCYFLTILPLPDPAKVAQYTTARYQLIPFRELVENYVKSGVVLSQPSTYLNFFRTRLFFQTIANVVMLIPLGLYLRYYFKRNFHQTVLIAFLFSLSFELIQLSGLFFIYPRPYRLADVDDLITNTLGGAIGYWLFPLVRRLLPDPDRLDEIARIKGARVTYTRRVIAWLIDMCCVAALDALLTFLLPDGFAAGFWPGMELLAAMLYFGLTSCLSGGYTLGKFIVRVRVVGANGERAAWWRLLLRYALLYLVFFPLPLYVVYWVSTAVGWFAGVPSDVAAISGMIAALMCLLGLGVHIVMCAFTEAHVLWHGKWSGTVDTAIQRETRRTNRSQN